MASVKQDSEQLIRIADDIRGLASDFLAEKNNFFDEVHNEIGEDESHKTW